MTPVSGERIVPPRIAPMLTSGQNPTPSAGSHQDSIPPSAPPIISSGASTAPEAPDPSDVDQMIDLTINTPTIRCEATSPCSSAPMVSYPTPSACGKTYPPMPMINPPMAGHHIQ